MSETIAEPVVEPDAESSGPVSEADWCDKYPSYFVDQYVQIYTGTAEDHGGGEWIPFRLWKEQFDVLDSIHESKQVVILKARQLGITWLCLAYALWLMLFRPAATVLFFSKRYEDSRHLLSDDRLRGMYRRLPAWMRTVKAEHPDRVEAWKLSNGSVARCFPTTGGDSYTATMVLVDEADLVPNLGKLMSSAMPTIGTGGKIILLSRSYKDDPESQFKKVYRMAKEGQSKWQPVFLSWKIRPDYTKEWYKDKIDESLHECGSLDNLWSNYPSTDVEALAPRSLDKRISAEWLQYCYVPTEPLKRPYGNPDKSPAIPGLIVYAVPRPWGQYVIGADPAEGKSDTEQGSDRRESDESSFVVLDRRTGEECARLDGRIEMSSFADFINQVGRWYNNALVLVERNNHGHAVLMWLKEHSKLRRLFGHDNKCGWMSSTKGKAIMYSFAAAAFRDGKTILHSFKTFTQLASIEISTLKAPKGLHDDLATSYSLALAAMARNPVGRIQQPWSAMSGGMPSVNPHKAAFGRFGQ